MSYTGDSIDADWRTKALTLEEAVQKLKAATARCKSEVAYVRGELTAVNTSLVREKAKATEDSASRGKYKDGFRDRERPMEMCALEAQLVTIKLGLAQARFERDSLQSEVRQLREKYATVAPSTSRSLPFLTRQVSRKNDPDILAAEVALKVGSVYQVGGLVIQQGVIKFRPAYRRALSRKNRELEIPVESIKSCTVEEVDHANGAIAQLLTKVAVGDTQEEQHHLVCFRSGSEIIHRSLNDRKLQQAQLPLANSALVPLMVSALSVDDNKGQDEPSMGLKGTASGPAPAVTSSPLLRPELKFTKKMSNPSEVLEPSQCAELTMAIPARFRTGDWQLLYSTSLHGYSLQTFYAKTARRSPTLIAIRDSEDNVFGCYAPVPWKQSHAYYGTGETFLFAAQPRVVVYKWAHSNSFFQLSGHDSLAVGGGGHFGLWVDSEFNIGNSGRSETFDNEPLSPHGDFHCVVFEAWTFVPRSQLRDCAPQAGVSNSVL
mmetsp:Transcript_38/g.107  ORF Transcript_38/g.107 Transcript_38/m.107 type:complete len:490 (+) Transcript_38:189-1658(+)|eukprot:CAMPEP_0198731136 /NCGR_PEP_ID=MMETSP1475-20131203/28276_1 /TAXON_ID= ORGANISM="Unidentified sp., Strain CCMP1999" /NCGR_SAMPLE_ID=MMETSP1475 /ASSEMBLY_ACC=CAM_ASM_001111 /LENGTH=489 /DNA_ID=CAMNT_0044494057 /DNA_START=184 /DNA_END=1653 /DNA_ORIENTATION=+